MSLIIAPLVTPPQLYNAKQVRYVDPSQNGIIHFVDGSSEVYGITTGTPPITFVPTVSANVVPNPGDWILKTRPSLNADAGAGVDPGTQSAAQQFQTPNAIAAGVGPFVVLTNAAFASLYNTNYAVGTPNQGIVP